MSKAKPSSTTKGAKPAHPFQPSHSIKKAAGSMLLGGKKAAVPAGYWGRRGIK